MSEKWRGIFKLIEEMGELQQVLGKLAAFPDGEHPSGAPIIEQLWEEVGDVHAALHYFIQENASAMDEQRERHRKREKHYRFDGWVLSGVKVDAQKDE